MEVLYFIIKVVCFVVAFRIYHYLMCKLVHHGKFVMDFSDPEKDFCRLEIDNLDDIYNKKYIILKVEKKDYQSQK